jgi:ABC-2 type transport system permease protein
MVIMGFSFSKSFIPQLGTVKVLYSTDNTAIDNEFRGFMSANAPRNMQLIPTGNMEIAKEAIRNHKYCCYIRLSDVNKPAQLYKNEQFPFEAGLVENLANNFMQNRHWNAGVRKNNQALPQALAKHGNYIEVKPFAGHRPGAIDYYAINMLTLFAIVAMFIGALSIKEEKGRKTGARLICSPVKKYEILIGKILGIFTTTILQSAVIFIFSVVVLRAYWGTHLGTILLILATGIFMAVSIGIGLAFAIKQDQLVMFGIMNILIPVFSTLGGSYFSIDGLGKAVIRVADLCPLRWINQAIMGVAFRNDFHLVAATITINLSLAVVFIVLSALFFKKEAVS